jgi:SNF2 family DNA or RNA helicase
MIPIERQALDILKEYNGINCQVFIKEQLKLEFRPAKIYIDKLLSRKDDVLQIWGCFGDNCDNHQVIFIPKECIKKTKEVPILDFSNYEREPKPHQITAIKELLRNEKFILADDMGLGKTTSAIIAAIEGNFKKILVVCPASLKLNWKKEIMNYDIESNISIVDSVDFRVNKWTIINYDILKNFHDLPTRGVKSDDEISPIDFHKFDLVIADEAHYLKNSTSNRTKIFNDFASRIPNRWLQVHLLQTNQLIFIIY